jgi:hypothetical protein
MFLNVEEEQEFKSYRLFINWTLLPFGVLWGSEHVKKLLTV